MLEMTEPQVWTLIGVFAAAIFGMITVVSTLFVRVIRSEIGGLRDARTRLTVGFALQVRKLL
jgi:hypothetical protein